LEGFILNTIDSGSSRKNLKFSKNFQFTFINRRPVNPIKEICRIFDGYYKKYNPYTKYVFFLNLKVEPNEIDVNLSPNKRDIFIKK
jgi:DNA mismatch repair protein PMS2